MSDKLYVEKHKGNGNYTIVAFNGRDPNYTGDKPLEWTSLLQDYYKDFIAFHDLNWRWYLDESCKEQIVDELKSFDTIDLAVGVSMGGWGVLYHQDLIPAKRIVAFGPQHRANCNLWNKIGPAHREWAEKIDPDADFTVQPYNGRDIKITFGLHPEDELHFKKFTELGYDTQKVKTKSHRAVNRLKRDGILFDYLFEDL